jgi:putative salt-induced outer membrane protein YdiY
MGAEDSIVRSIFVALLTLAMAGPTYAQGDETTDDEAPATGDTDSDAEETPAKGGAPPDGEDGKQEDEAPADDSGEGEPEEPPTPEEPPAAEEPPAPEEPPAAEEPPAPEEPPAAEEEEPEEADPVISLVGEAGAVWLAGNTSSITANGSVTFIVTRDRNRFGLQFGGSFGRSRIEDVWITTATRLSGNLRYDRLLTDINSLYLLGVASHDPFAGSLAKIAVNFGYSHLLVRTEHHKLTLEGGVNYTHDEYTGDPLPDPVSQNLLGGRGFVSYALDLNGTFGFSQSIEAILGGTDNEAARFDGSIAAITGLTANITRILGVKIGFTLTYDFVPPEGFKPLDTTTSLTLVATML